MNKLDPKYKAITCEVVELLAKHGLTVEETEFVVDYAKSVIRSTASVTQSELEEIRNLLK